MLKRHEMRSLIDVKCVGGCVKCDNFMKYQWRSNRAIDDA